MTDTPLRICLVSPVPPPYGGIGHWTLMVSQYAATQPEVQLHVVNTAPRWRAVDDLAVWKRVVGGGLQLVRDYLRVVGQLRKRPHVIHLTTSGQLAVIRDLVVMKAARRRGVPVIYHIRFGRIPQLAGGQSREWKLISQAMRLAHTVMAIDAATAEAIRHHIPEANVVEVPNCVDLRKLPQTADTTSTNTVMFLGWVIPTKGIEELVQAWAELRPEGWSLQIVGPGSADYQQQLQEKYQPANIEFFGEKSHDEAMRLMKAAGIFVLPSYTEGFPNVIVESMALGKPIIATRVGAIPEMLPDGCGLLVDARDVSGLKTALAQLIADTELRERLGVHAQERAVAHYSLETVFARYIAIWKQAAKLK